MQNEVIKKDTNTAIISDIQRFSVHDGPGIRTIVFFKGCPLRCQWCQNPETYSIEKQLMYTRERCILCGLCIKACPQQAIGMDRSGLTMSWDKCNNCGECTKVCFSGAREVVGREMTVDEVVEEVMKDEVFYRNTNGGVTLSGGDVTLQAPFAARLLRVLKEKGIHNAIETCGYSRWEALESILYYTDLVLYDIKLFDSGKHKYYTGAGNEPILQNLMKIARMNIPLVLRYPFVPGVNDTVEDLRNLAELALKTKALSVHIMPFHQLGEPKWYGTGKPYLFSSAKSPTEEALDHAKETIEAFGVTVNIGGYGAY